MNKKKRVFMLLIVFVVLVVGLIFFTKMITTFSGYIIKNTQGSSATCLSRKNIILYCNSDTFDLDCSYQKRVIKDISQDITYILCDTGGDCADMNKLPAWKINGKLVYGILELDKIKELAGC